MIQSIESTIKHQICIFLHLKKGFMTFNQDVEKGTISFKPLKKMRTLGWPGSSYDGHRRARCLDAIS